MRTPVIFAIIVSAACGDDGGQPADAPPIDTLSIDEMPIDAPEPDAPPPMYTTVIEFPSTPNRDLDLLFVIDDSPSMTDKQQNLATSFPAFVNHLLTANGGLPDLHIGVISTDMGTKGTGSVTAHPVIGQLGQGGCASTGDDGALQINGASVTGTFITDVALAGGGRARNYSGTLTSTFGTMARLGIGGCGFEQPLHAMKRAFENTANTGFVRPDALLAVVFLTDEDDCSVKSPTLFGPESATLGPQQSFRCTRFGVTCATGGATPDAMNQVGTKAQCAAAVGSPYLDDVGPYRDALVTLKGNDARKIVVASIAGPSTPVAVELRSPPVGGAPFPALARSCTYLGSAGTEVGEPAVRLDDFLSRFPNRHVNASICQDLSSSLVQIGDVLLQSLGSSCLGETTIPAGTDCIAEDVVGTVATPIAACGTPPCFEIVVDATACPHGDHQRLEVTRTSPADPGTITRLRCRL